MLIGYARVSTDDQNPDLQEDALRQAGCEKIFIDKTSGMSANRPQLDKLVEQLRPGDVLVIWRLDRLGRSLLNLVEWANFLERAQVEFRSLRENIDTTTPGGRLYFHLNSAYAQYERDIIVDRTKAGLAAARARGRVGGRPTKLDVAQRQHVVGLHAQGRPIKEICDLFNIPKGTLLRYVRLAREGFKTQPPEQ